MTCFGHIIHDCYISLNWGKHCRFLPGRGSAHPEDTVEPCPTFHRALCRSGRRGDEEIPITDMLLLTDCILLLSPDAFDRIGKGDLVGLDQDDYQRQEKD